ncbi:MAG TPA: hypothetical protein VFE53_05740 [Mucilaginibacter sp.]|jgi:hypothetical protein|nr:hypothetical protein [Mucilaginibacter sp.]
MNLTSKIALLALVLQCFSCSHPAPKKNLSFLDSLKGDTALTERQLRRHTILPPDYYRNTSHYTGDTIYHPGSKQPVAIIACDYHGVCEYSYLLVFDGTTLKNTSFKKVKESCDSDGDQGYIELDFAMINDTLFYTKDIYTRKFDDKPDLDSIVAKHYFKIDKDGKIDSLAGYPLPTGGN